MFDSTDHGESDRSSWIDPATLMRVKGLPLRARVVVEGLFSGLHRSPYHGFSVEFSEYRQYTPGDDPRYLDWRLFARTDRYYVKRFEDETNVRCHLLVDLSRSMGFGSLAYPKIEYARTLAATFAYYLASQRDAVGLLTFHQELAEYIPARFRPGHLHRLMVALEHALAGRSTDLGRPLEHLAELVHKRGLIVLISDLLTPIDQLREHLLYLCCRGHEVVLMRVLDPAERDFRFSKAALFRDLETGRTIYVDPQVAEREYQRRFAEHAGELNRICNELGIDLFEFTTERPLELALFDFIQARMRRGRIVARRQQRAPARAVEGAR
jgi:uncharacterized protein (DUF58 family)